MLYCKMCNIRIGSNAPFLSCQNEECTDYMVEGREFYSFVENLHNLRENYLKLIEVSNNRMASIDSAIEWAKQNNIP